LLDPTRNQSMREELHAVADKLGEPGASRRAAQAILQFISVTSSPYGRGLG